MPGLEHRYCVRHLHANMKGKVWKGKEFTRCGVQPGRPMKSNLSTTSLSLEVWTKKLSSTLRGLTQKCGQGTHSKPSTAVTSC
jgi:hypothetical protein